MGFDVVATLRDAATATLGGGAVSTLGNDGGGGWGIRLAAHNCRELEKCGKMPELGTGCSWDCMSKFLKEVGHHE